MDWTTAQTLITVALFVGVIYLLLTTTRKCDLDALTEDHRILAKKYASTHTSFVMLLRSLGVPLLLIQDGAQGLRPAFRWDGGDCDTDGTIPEITRLVKSIADNKETDDEGFRINRECLHALALKLGYAVGYANGKATVFDATEGAGTGGGITIEHMSSGTAGLCIADNTFSDTTTPPKKRTLAQQPKRTTKKRATPTPKKKTARAR